MNEGQFDAAYSQTLMTIEDRIEDSGADIDYESVNGILTLTCNDGSVIIITPQSATRQLWVAAKSGGFHFDFDAGRGHWVCTADGETLPDKLTTFCLQQGGVTLDFT